MIIETCFQGLFLNKIQNKFIDIIVILLNLHFENYYCMSIQLNN